MKKQLLLRSCSKRGFSIENGDGKEAIPHRSYRRAVEARRTVLTRRQAGRTTSQDRLAGSAQRLALSGAQWMPVAHDSPRVPAVANVLQLLPCVDRQRHLG